MVKPFYSLDTSGLLDGWVRYYPPVTFLTLWTNVEDLIDEGRLIATEEVLMELSKQGDDEIVKWCKVRKATLFLPIDSWIQIKVADILRTHPNLVDAGKGRSGADPFVIALAELRSSTVVTGETPSNKPQKPKIPDVCKDRGVKHCTFLEMIQQEKWTF
jgi:hypothetical protein